jgi:AcrR family transcriptional regulator
MENLSMQTVADAVGVRAPSLYKRFASKSDLLSAISIDTLLDLQVSLDKVIRPRSVRANLERMAGAYRTFAKKNPRAYQLIYAESQASGDSESDLKARISASAALLSILKEAIGEQNALLGARTIVAFMHGFVSMEMTGLFRLGGDIDAAFTFGIVTILDALLGAGAKSRVLPKAPREFAKSSDAPSKSPMKKESAEL